MAIRLLPVDVSSKIAAGEVIERPASMVKELLENSLDAGATEIGIEIRAGGAEFVRVTDNGTGIAADDVELALQRFATSKIADVGDLEVISTLGFRGEALPSIAAVSSLSLETRTGAEQVGTRIDVVEGSIVRKEQTGTPPGTSVTVRDLFKSFPARRKFLRSTATESSRIQTLVTRYALAYPEIRFRLEGERSSTFTSAGSGDLREAISSVYGPEVARGMLEISQEAVEGAGQHPSIWGMIGPPTLHRASRSHVSLFVNRRWVQNRSMAYAIEQSYHGFLMERRYPLAVVNITLANEDVDVNVHPAKTEVRFRHERQVFGALQQAVRQTLMAHSPVPEIMHARPTSPPPTRRPAGATLWPIGPFDTHATASAGRPQPPSTPAAPLSPYPDPLTPKKALPALRVLGQVQSAYVAAEGPDGMYLIDQHAAHERVVFERVRADFRSRTPHVQSLLEPVTVELNPGQRELLESQRELIAALGFHIESFGPDTYLLRGVPSLLIDGDLAEAFQEVLETMAEGGGFDSWEERAAYSIACHGAIRAGKTLSQQEMSELARQLEECQQPNTCPHGRPTMIHLSSSHLEREFGRR